MAAEAQRHPIGCLVSQFRMRRIGLEMVGMEPGVRVISDGLRGSPTTVDARCGASSDHSPPPVDVLLRPRVGISYLRHPAAPVGVVWPRLGRFHAVLVGTRVYSGADRLAVGCREWLSTVPVRDRPSPLVRPRGWWGRITEVGGAKLGPDIRSLRWVRVDVRPRSSTRLGAEAFVLPGDRLVALIARSRSRHAPAFYSPNVLTGAALVPS